MSKVIQFPQPALDSSLVDLLERAESLMADFSAEQIILALFEKAIEPDDIATLMPAFKRIVDKQ